MKKLFMTMVAAAFVLSACGDDNNNEPAPANDGNNNLETNEVNEVNENNEANENAADNNAMDLANGEELYAQNCTSCHGGDLEGGMGPGLVGASYDQVMDILVNDPDDTHEGRVSEEEAEELASWIEEQ